MAGIIEKLAFGMHQWIGTEKLRDIEYFLEAHRNTSGIFDGDFLDVYLPTQPNLLCVLTFIGFVSLLIFLLFVVFIIARYFGICGLGLSGKTGSGCALVVYNALLVFCWTLLLGAALIFVTSYHQLGPILPETESEKGIDTYADVAQITAQSNFTEHISIGLHLVTIVDKTTSDEGKVVDEVEILNKYTEIRELGYEFKPVEDDTTYQLQYVVFTLIACLIFLCVILSAVALVFGMRNFEPEFHPMDRSDCSNYAGRVLSAVGVFLFIFSPFLSMFGAIVLAYAHAHSTMCTFVQAEMQNQSMEQYVNANYAFFDANNLIDFLTDLRAEREEINERNCHLYLAPIEKIWFCMVLISWVSLPLSICLVRVANYFVKTSAKYSWDPSETYSTIPEKSNAPFSGIFVPRYN